MVMRSDIPETTPPCKACESDDVTLIEAALAEGREYYASAKWGISVLELNRHHAQHKPASHDKRRVRLIVADLAETGDYTAVLGIDAGVDAHHIAFLRRWQGIPYIAPDGEDSIVSRLGALVLEKSPVTLLGLDGSGVGRPVVQAVRAELGADWKNKTIGVYIVGGDVMNKGRDRTVSKTPLIAGAQVAVQRNKVRVKTNYKDSESAALVPILMNEMAGYRQARTKSGRLEFGNDVGAAEWRTARNDDLVLALAIGVLLADEAMARQRQLDAGDAAMRVNRELQGSPWWQ